MVADSACTAAWVKLGSGVYWVVLAVQVVRSNPSRVMAMLLTM